ncbi:DUF2603 domain-containing protein [Campylobacter geochelonis]|uniref:UPF0763 protein ERS672216_01228 n=1 Tax=Campylobacter geochelonis TaxID=1780362 RepID=A0A128EEQ1_9BACT|nr:DUF2603 domain-containing protein [Campylobacter geochelonis]QKF70813.1 DUF2603 domain-containing protein [Campylobacter geochelonis]CZE47396.1 4-hydroxy-3-methylbut-2-en-1-yl diphosphate synthase [Campylobacter geochelonis]CZE48085.1 4-hydroxy-3-methylbut-2-en-1-yl diphosphate synthase [Campylobacter geochelonis]CZE50582.1 4-hydroxy-3-methylbut-2-en-1-yl diphosphate synthase [Campylobacter geochelonis]
MAKQDECEKIEQISKALGFNDGEKTIFEIVESENKNQKMLTLKSGSWSSKEPWFGVDENKDLHTMVSIKSLNGLIDAYRKLARENFDLRLEKSILQHVPIDFGDVWTVCMDEIRNIAIKNPENQVLSVNLNEIVEKVRQEHPNLFVNLDSIINRTQESL